MPSVEVPRSGNSLFPNTSWGIVLAARDDESGREGVQHARPPLLVANLCPACASSGFAPADAEDLVQGFFPASGRTPYGGAS